MTARSRRRRYRKRLEEGQCTACGKLKETNLVTCNNCRRKASERKRRNFRIKGD